MLGYIIRYPLKKKCKKLKTEKKISGLFTDTSEHIRYNNLYIQISYNSYL